MELPHLGRQCAKQGCGQLDFLPYKCNACSATFCQDHYSYTAHECPEAYRKNVVVPECPLCGELVTFSADGDPNIAMERHIQRGCKPKKPNASQQAYRHACAQPGCKKKEGMKLNCASCGRNFCLKHRHESDHACVGRDNGAAGRGNGTRPQQAAASAAAARRSTAKPTQQRRPPTTNPRAANGMSEDQALQAAIAASLQDGSTEETDPELARALAESMREQQRQQSRSEGGSCGVQ
eukprot:m.250692 g.250692  ORF g.250692 m.250692 type:complete len:237 (-) comp19101_c0_seq1:1404-2114(-)